MKLKITIFSGAVMTALIALNSQAQTLLTENFTYADGAIVGASGSPWVNNSGTAGQFNVVGGALFLDDTDTEDIKAPLSAEVTSGILTATFSLRGDPLDVSSGAGNYIAHFVGDSDFVGAPAAFIGRLFTKTPNVVATGAYTLGIANSTGTAASAVYFTSDLATGTTYTVSMAYNFSTLTTTLTVDGIGSIVATDTAAATVRISDFGFRESTLTGDFFIDNLSVSVSSVPEPSTTAFVLGGVVLIGAMVSRRRRAEVNIA